MLTLGSLAFATPIALLALILLPGIWWLLRLTPPAPKRIPFPPVRFLAGLASTEESAARTPPWLLVLRIVLALAVVFGAAHPLINAGGKLAGSGPMVLIVDDGWAAARDWPARQAMMTGLIDNAEREGRSVAVATTAATDVDAPRQAIRLFAAGEARKFAQGLQPKPWETDRPAAVEALIELARETDWRPGAVIWLSDGLEEADADKGIGIFAESLKPLGAVTVVSPSAVNAVKVLRTPAVDDKTLVFNLMRSNSAGETVVVLRALSEDGGLLAREKVRFADGKRRIDARLTLPAEFLNRLARVEIEGENTAAAVVLVDLRWQRRPVGLVTGEGGASDQPLLGSLYYLERALAPMAEVRQGSVAGLLARELAVLVVADGAGPTANALDAVVRWVERGGVLLRFAGPRLASNPGMGDPLLPVQLRGGDRTIGGALSWRSPAKLAPFPANSPFFGLTVPADVEIRRQVLAQPSLDLAQHTWAQLDDGTPLVTATRRGDGWLVLVHTTANAEWSDLPLSGLFVEMLERMIALSRGASAGPGGPPLAPLETLDGFGRLGSPPSEARAIAADVFAETRAGPRHPPGFYGGGEGRHALNLSETVPDPTPLGSLPQGIVRTSYGGASEIDLRPWLLGIALFLAIVDLAVSLALRGFLRMPGTTARRNALGTAVIITAAAIHGAALAQMTITDGTAMPSSLTTRLAYVLTGDAEVDAVSRAGLTGLGAVVNRRTAVELGPPVAVDPETDELVFYPLLYWPLSDGAAPPSPRAADRLVSYMRSGGTILFDTRTRGGGIRPGGLRNLAAALDIPPLIPAPKDHLLGRAYYLLSDFPGRWTGGTVWVEPGGEHVNDGVTPVIAGSHDWAGAWAVDEALRPMFTVVPGGERQREMAYRFGVNVVMYVLTGSYKADQVHLPAILERLGQ